MYAIVEFIVEGACEMVPKSWLINSNTMCYWPPKSMKTYEIATYIKRMKNPHSDWKPCPVRILSEAVTFDEARRKLKRATVDSDISIDTENYGVGKRKRRPVFESSDEDTDIRKETKKTSKIVSTLPDPPVTHFLESDAESDDREWSSQRGLATNSPKTPNQRSVQPVQTPTTDSGSFFRSILRELALIRAVQAKHTEQLDILMEKNNACEAEVAQSVVKIDFPVAEEEELIKLNSALDDAAYEKGLILKFRAFGGSNHSDHGRRILKYLMTDSLAENYNWVGTRDKKGFSSLKICRVIADAVVEEHRANGVTRLAVEGIIKSWLRHANGRKVSAEKKNKKKQENRQ